jgi:hypothetical protein
MGAVFISYSHKDGEFVERLRQAMSSVGLSIWIDHEGLLPGIINWDKAINTAIQEAAAVVYVVSVNAYQSENCQGELALVRRSNRKIYPVFFQGDNFVSLMPTRLNHFQYFDMRSEAAYRAGLPQ